MKRETAVQSPVEAKKAPTGPATPERVLKLILEGVDREDKFVRAAAACFREEHEEAMRTEIPEDRVVHRISAPEVLEAVVAHGRAKIDLETLRRQTKLAEQKLKLVSAAVMHAVNAFEDVDADVQFEVDAHRLVLTRAAEDESLAVVREKVMAMLDMDAPALAAISGRDFPPDWKPLMQEEDGMAEFLVDMADFFKENGAEGRALARRISRNPAIAASSRGDDRLPKPVRFFARLFCNNGRH